MLKRCTRLSFLPVPMGRTPTYNLSLPVRDIEIYVGAFAKERQGLCRTWGTQETSAAQRCKAENCSITVEEDRCHTLLFHGKLDEACLVQRNLTAESLLCVRALLITSFMGSGTAYIASAIQAQHEKTQKEPDKLVGWLCRTDVWELSNYFRGGLTHNRTFEMEHMRWHRQWAIYTVSQRSLIKCTAILLRCNCK